MDVDETLNRGRDEKVRDLVQVSADAVGGAAGAAMGFLLGGPAGAVAGAAGGPVVARTVRGLAVEFYERVLGERERFRVSMAINFATAKIRTNIESGEEPRQDDFFGDRADNRATAKEVFEGVVLAAQREAEEKKVRLYGNLLGNLAFAQDVDASQANFLVRLGEGLSYRQLCLLSLFAQNNLLLGGDNRLNLRAGDYRESGVAGMDMIVLLQETYDLYQRGIVNCGGAAMISVGDVDPSQMSPQGAAINLYNLMELGTVSPDDLNALIRLLR